MAKKQELSVAELVLELDGALELVEDASAVEVSVEDWERLVTAARAQLAAPARAAA